MFPAPYCPLYVSSPSLQINNYRLTVYNHVIGDGHPLLYAIGSVPFLVIYITAFSLLGSLYHHCNKCITG